VAPAIWGVTAGVRTQDPHTPFPRAGTAPTYRRGATSDTDDDCDALMTTNRTIDSYLMDMDGVIVHEEQPIPGADRFIGRLHDTGHRFLVLTNNSMYTPGDLSARLAQVGVAVPREAIWTSALATATFLADQRPEGTAFVIGEAGLTTALHAVGYTLTDRDPDYVVLGETRSYSFERITRAIRLIAAGARFIATNPDPTSPSTQGALPATGSVAALISRATGVEPYYVGKPNPLMMRSALRAIDAHSETTVMIGDRMDTDIVAGMEAGLETVLVLSGITKAEDTGRFPFRPSRIVDSVADLVDDIDHREAPPQRAHSLVVAHR
jgi:NagD protein